MAFNNSQCQEYCWLSSAMSRQNLRPNRQIILPIFKIETKLKNYSPTQSVSPPYKANIILEF